MVRQLLSTANYSHISSYVEMKLSSAFLSSIVFAVLFNQIGVCTAIISVTNQF